MATRNVNDRPGGVAPNVAQKGRGIVSPAYSGLPEFEMWHVGDPPRTYGVESGGNDA